MVKYKSYKYNQFDHLAGIIPIGGKDLDFKMPWHDSLMPIAPDLLAIEHAVNMCAMAGCDTIWIVGHKGTTPLIRNRLRDFILDPVSLLGHNPAERQREIPIFYVPILPRDYDKRDCLAWSVLHGADSAFRVSGFLSRWTVPKRFFCAFPYGVISEKEIRNNREAFRKENTFLFTSNGKSVKDGLHIPFTFTAKDYKVCRDIIRKKNIEDWEQRKEKDATEFTLSEVFNSLDTQNTSMVELSWFYDISSWENYRNYISSEEAKNIKRNNRIFIRESRKLFPTEKDLRESLEKKQDGI